MSTLLRLFRDPPARFRGAPFWSWNDLLDQDELVRQVADMKQHGMGGFFIHSREGLETPYMGEDWLAAVRAVVEAARRQGMHPWLYDEDRWPSGAAGGLVPARGGDAFRGKALTLEIAAALPGVSEDVVAVYRARQEGGKLLYVERMTRADTAPLRPGEVALVLRREVAAPTEWYNDDAPADNLNPDSVAAFIDITYETYRRLIGDDFGDLVPGIFTDEPNVNDMRIESGLPHLPWTDGLDAYFRARRGYDFLDVAPYMFLDGERSAKARHDFWWTISERFTEAYSAQIGGWCEAHGLAFTGHYLEENVLGFTIWRSGAVMPHYRHQHVPGIDMLCEQTNEYLTVKQCTSVAHQFGRPFVLSETYGCTGWAFTFEGQKWIGDWQYVLGVNLRCQHLALYTLKGCRKRDYPPCFNYNTTWWKYNGVVEDYFARLGAALSLGEPVRDVLVIHPIATCWMMVEGAAREFPPSRGVQAANDFGWQLNAFARAVLATHYDFDFGDEQIMADVAHVEGVAIQVNRAVYRVVVIPPGTRTLLRSTLDLLERFAASGGKIVAFAPTPDLVEALPDERVAALFSRPEIIILKGIDALQAALERAIPRRISLVTETGQQAAQVLVQQRVVEDEHKTVLFAVNNDRERSVRVTVVWKETGRLEEWNPLTGESWPVAAETDDGAIRFQADFGPAGSRLYVLHHDVPPLPEAVRQVREGERIAAYFGPTFSFTRTDPNVLTLDVCAWRTEEEAWSVPMPVWQAQQAVRERLGMRPVYANRLPQRHKWVHTPHPQDGRRVAFQFTFEVRDVPRTPVYLLVENVAAFDLTFNGEAVPAVPDGWYLDRSFHRVPLPALKPGRNVLTLACAYRERMEIEDCYLLGDFGVDANRVIVAEPDSLRLGDWALQGYLHYAGSMIYHATYTHRPGEHVYLTLGSYAATTVAVHVNGALAGHIPWRAANDLDLTPVLHEGENRIDIEVVGSPRNMLGPLHLKAGDEPWTDWRSFRTTGERYTPDYVVVPYGLLSPVQMRAWTLQVADNTGPYLWEDRQ